VTTRLLEICTIGCISNGSMVQANADEKSESRLKHDVVLANQNAASFCYQ